MVLVTPNCFAASSEFPGSTGSIHQRLSLLAQGIIKRTMLSRMVLVISQDLQAEKPLRLSFQGLWVFLLSTQIHK